MLEKGNTARGAEKRVCERGEGNSLPFYLLNLTELMSSHNKKHLRIIFKIDRMMHEMIRQRYPRGKLSFEKSSAGAVIFYESGGLKGDRTPQLGRGI